MPFTYRAPLLAFVISTATPGSVWAFGGVGGCNSLPEYYRALGVMQGNMESACAMTVEQARRILAGYGVPAAMAHQVAPAPRLRRRHERRKPL